MVVRRRSSVTGEYLGTWLLSAVHYASALPDRDRANPSWFCESVTNPESHGNRTTCVRPTERFTRRIWSLARADEVGLAFLDEGLHGFLVVLGVEGHHLVGERCIHDQVGLLLEPLVDCEFTPTDGPGRAVGQLLRKLARLA